jgi:glycosyltransferase involved in cell wall biosynthesis
LILDELKASHSCNRPLNLIQASSFLPVENTGAAGSLMEIARGLRAIGHRVEELWIPDSGGGRWQKEFLRPAIQSRLLLEAIAKRPDLDAVMVSQPYCWKAFRAIRKQFPKVALINRTHGWEARGIERRNITPWENPGNIFKRFGRSISQALMKGWCEKTLAASDILITPSKRGREWIREEYPHFADKVVNVPYGFDKNKIPDQKPSKNPDTVQLVFAGQYMPVKGCRVLEQYLPDIAAAYPNTSLKMIVQDSAQSRVRERLGKHWGNRLNIIPWVDRETLFKELMQSDIFLAPSYFEGWCKTAMEAVMVGCHVVGFAEGFLAEAKCSRVHVVAVADAEGFSIQLKEVIENYLVARESMDGPDGYPHVISWEDSARLLAHAIGKVVVSRQGV